MSGVPKPDKADFIYALGRGSLSAVPIIGGAVAELMSLVIAPPLARRRDEWMDAVNKALLEREGTTPGFKLEHLAENEVFITTMLRATQAAIKTHQTEKRVALKSAVINAAIGAAPEEDLQAIFLTLVDIFTPLHVRILRFIEHEPATWDRIYETSSFKAHFPELAGRDDLCQLIIKDLHDARLINSNTTSGTYTGYMAFAGAITDLGRQFLKFITLVS